MREITMGRINYVEALQFFASAEGESWGRSDTTSAQMLTDEGLRGFALCRIAAALERVEILLDPEARRRQENQKAEAAAQRAEKDERHRQMMLKCEEARAWIGDSTAELSAPVNRAIVRWLARNGLGIWPTPEQLKGVREIGPIRAAEYAKWYERLGSPEFIAERSKLEARLPIPTQPA